jgi:hypothetical protein
MTHLLAPLLLFLATTAWFLLALLPAIRELVDRTDNEPLRLSHDAADIRFFAQSFRRYVNENLQRLRAAASDHVCVIVELDRDTAWYASRASGVKRVFEGCDASLPLEKLVAIAEGDVRVSDDFVMPREIYSGASLHGGARATFRALLVEHDATLGAETTVVRWADAGRTLRVGANSTLFGRASAGDTMVLAEGTRFERLAAPRIVFGAAEPEGDDARVARKRRLARAAHTAFPPPDNAAISEGRWALEGDLHIPDGHVINSDLVVTGELTMGRGAKIEGAVRARTITAADDCVFTGSIVAEKYLALGAQCHVTGPIAVEGEAVLGDECRIGEVGDETTISVIRIRVGRRVELSGEIWARSLGMVVAEESQEAPQAPRPKAVRRPTPAWRKEPARTR